MEFRIADTFTDSLARLTGDEQKAVKTTAFDLQLNPANPGMSFHKIEKAKDKNFWSIRVNKDIRIILHKVEGSLLLCYVNHHDKAYEWAERRKLEVHPKTGAAQLVEIRERVHEIIVPVYVNTELQIQEKQKLFDNFSDEDLLSYGVPPEWLHDVKNADEEELLILTDHLPAEAAEALLEVATGGKPRLTTQVKSTIPPFEHPDAQRRFMLMRNEEELQRALEFPWDKWAVFLHPIQREIAEGDYSGPIRISGSAGTGKSIVALHRAVFLAKQHIESRILLTTHSAILANTLKVNLRKLTSNTPRLAERIDIYPIDEIGIKLYKLNIGEPNIANERDFRNLITEVVERTNNLKFSIPFLLSEYQTVFDAWQINSWEDYRTIKRLGRKTRLPEEQRMVIWYIFNAVNQIIKEEGLISISNVFTQLADYYSKVNNKPYDFVVVDESQDISIYHLKFLAALCVGQPNGLFFTGDLGQRIFQQLFSWKALGIDIKGRSKTLKINYRTSHQIKMKADHILAPEVTDADGNIEYRRSTTSVFNGPVPIIKKFDSKQEETTFAADWIVTLHKQGIALHEIAIIVRSEYEIEQAIDVAKATELPYTSLELSMETLSNSLVITTMHFSKGLTFRASAVIACNDEIIPSQSRISSITDSADLEDVYNTERQLLYVACTRAREHLLVCGVVPVSEFLNDLELN